MPSLRSIGNFFSFLTSAPPAPVTTTDDKGVTTTTMVAAPTAFVSPDVVEEYYLVGQIVLGTAAAVPAAFNDFPLAGISFNPPLSAFSVSKIRGVVLRAPPLPHDCNWYAGIWCALPQATAAGARDHTAVSMRAPNAVWYWRSNVTVPQPAEVSVPWPSGRPVSDSLHATLPGLHAPSLQIGLCNRPSGSASALPVGQYTFDVIVHIEAAGRGMFGTI